MIGTVVGLVGMFIAMDDPATIGPAMALALLTTLYGLFVSAVIATPIAGRLERLSIAERRWKVAALRSEEHTSELQSLMRISYAVFCLKKNKQTHHTVRH